MYEMQLRTWIFIMIIELNKNVVVRFVAALYYLFSSFTYSCNVVAHAARLVHSKAERRTTGRLSQRKEMEKFVQTDFITDGKKKRFGRIDGELCCLVVEMVMWRFNAVSSALVDAAC